MRQELDAGADFSMLQEKLRCGTFCGSCVPEIRRMVIEFAGGALDAFPRNGEKKPEAKKPDAP